MTLRCPICNNGLFSNMLLCPSCKEALDSECFDSFLERCQSCYFPLISPTYKCPNCSENEFTIYAIARYDGNLSNLVFESFKHNAFRYAPVIAHYFNQALDVLDPNKNAIVVPLANACPWSSMNLVARYLKRKVLNILTPIDQKKTKDVDKGLAYKNRRIIIVCDVCFKMDTIKSAIKSVKDAGFDDVCASIWLLDFINCSDDLSSNLV